MAMKKRKFESVAPTWFRVAVGTISAGCNSWGFWFAEANNANQISCFSKDSGIAKLL